MNIRFEYPCSLLQPFIECYWSWESDNCEYELHHLPRIIPSMNMEMILFYKEPFSISDRKGDGHRLPQSHFVFWMREAYSLSLPKGKEIGFVAIRFRPGCFSHFYKGTMDELIDPFLPIPEVWGASGEELTERVMEAADFEKLTLEGFLDIGFIKLTERVREEIVLAEVGRPWKANGDLRELNADQFCSFNESGFVKIVWNFHGKGRGEGMKNVWKYSGWYLIVIGVIHNAVGLLLGQDILLEMLADGVINTVNMEYDRNFLFWFLAIGFVWIGTGIHWQSILRTFEKPLPSFLGWGVLLFALIGVAFSPASGIWLFFPLAWMILQPHLLHRA